MAKGKWYEDHRNLAALWTWLDENGQEPRDPSHFMEKPWKWDEEWKNSGLKRADEEKPEVYHDGYDS